VDDSLQAPPQQPVNSFEEPVEEESNQEVKPQPGRMTPGYSQFALPVIALAFALFLVGKTMEIRQSNTALTWQGRNFQHQLEAFTATQDNLSALLLERESLVEESRKVSFGYNAFLNDLIHLAETDADARAVVEKFSIKSLSGGQEGTPLTPVE
jgi:hypothetical protein